jgi:Fe-S oxidoreductase
VFATTLPGASEVKHLPAKRLMHLCTQCGVCKEVCPEDIDIGGLILAGRQQMHRYGKAPWAFHDFFLRDMEHADGEAARVAFMPADKTKSDKTKIDAVAGSYAFFPGCQIGAGDPELVLRTYGALREIDPGVGMLLRCCGAPAEWAGESERHAETLAGLRAGWSALGAPTLLMACPTCVREFREHMPDIAVTSVYEWLAERPGAPDRYSSPDEAEVFRVGAKVHDILSIAGADAELPAQAAMNHRGEKPWAVFDPCSSRHEEGARAAVRALARRAGLTLRELPIQGEIVRCCGYGGQPSVADPAFAEEVAADRAGESALPYLTWCFNCRDVFMKQGKETTHILELLFPDGGKQALLVDIAQSPPPLPTVTERRRNREYLKKKLLREYANGSSFDQRRFDKKVSAQSAGEVSAGVTGANGMSVNGVGVTGAGGISEGYGFVLRVPDELLRKMDAEKILEDDVYRVVDFARRTGRKIFDPAAGTHSCYRKIGHMTYWVDYRESEGRSAAEKEELTVTGVYAHRMAIHMEQIWNGRKTREEFLDE